MGAISLCRKQVRRVRRSEFLRNVVLLASGTAGAQVIMAGSMPVLSRLYNPEAFGVLAVFTAVTSVLTVLATCKYELAIVLPREDDDAANIFVLTCLIALAVSLAAIPVIAIARSRLGLENSGPGQLILQIGVPFAVLMAGTSRVFEFWATRRKSFKCVSFSQVFRSSSRAGVQILGGLAGLGANGLIVGRLAGSFVGAATVGYCEIRKDARLILACISAKKLKIVAREYSVFPKYNLPRAIINTASQNLTPLLLIFFFDAAVAGLYWFAFRLLEVPVTLVSKPVRRVFYQRAVELHRGKGDLAGLFMKTTLLLCGLAAGPIAAIILFGPALFGVVFGDSWERAGEYSQWLVIGWLTTFTNVPSVMLIPVFNL